MPRLEAQALSGAAAAVGFYGLDLYSLYTSVAEVIAYLEQRSQHFGNATALGGRVNPPDGAAGERSPGFLAGNPQALPGVRAQLIANERG